MTINKYLTVAAVAALLATSCGSPSQKLVNKADKKFEEEGAYEPAIQLYQQALTEDGANKQAINFKIAESYRLSNRLEEAVPFYDAAITEGLNKPEAHFYRALGNKDLGNYSLAQQQMKEYLDMSSASSGSEARVMKKRAEMEVENLKKVDQIAQKENTYVVNSFAEVNTAEAEYAPYFADGKLYFTSARGEGQTYAGNGMGFTNIYMYNFDGSSETSGAVVPLPEIINTPNAHEATSAISPDGKMMLFARSNDGSRKGEHREEVQIYVSYMRNGAWSEPQLFGPINKPQPKDVANPNASWNSFPAFSADGNTVYFASNRKGGEGNIDLYRVKKDASNRWSRVTNLGATINTPGDDMAPHITEDGRLIFASDGHPGLGGLDIFIAEKTDDGVVVENMGKPINSTGDDFGLIFTDQDHGYMTSNRVGGSGGDDIYKVKNDRVIIKNVMFVLDADIKGKSSSMEPAPLNDAKVTVLDSDGKEIKTYASSPFSIDLDNGKSYTFVIERDGYFTKRETYSTYGKRPSDSELKEGDNEVKLNQTFVIDLIEKNRAIVLDNIYYDYNSYAIRDDAAEELDKMVELLQDNPDIKVELSSHTDARGKDASNQKLSQSRAESAVEYIVSKGISQDRIIARGYGEARPRKLETAKGAFEAGSKMTEQFISSSGKQRKSRRSSSA